MLVFGMPKTLDLYFWYKFSLTQGRTSRAREQTNQGASDGRS
jgi:hypothetical protein